MNVKYFIGCEIFFNVLVKGDILLDFLKFLVSLVNSTNIGLSNCMNQALGILYVFCCNLCVLDSLKFPKFEAMSG